MVERLGQKNAPGFCTARARWLSVCGAETGRNRGRTKPPGQPCSLPPSVPSPPPPSLPCSLSSSPPPFLSSFSSFLAPWLSFCITCGDRPTRPSLGTASNCETFLSFGSQTLQGRGSDSHSHALYLSHGLWFSWGPRAVRAPCSAAVWSLCVSHQYHVCVVQAVTSFWICMIL